MAILAGIDEAGYGPTLGPLIVSGVALRVPDDRLDVSLWNTLRNTISQTSTRAGRRLVVTDSKKLYHSRGSLAPLERAALVMLAVARRRPKSWRGLLRVLAPHTIEQLSQYPWYREAEFPLPTSDEVGDIGTRANAIRRDCAQQNVEPVGVFCEPILEGHFNRLVQNTRNKAVVLLGLALRVVDRVFRLAPNERVRLCVDRLGGRQHYREALVTALPGHEMQILEESAERSAYRMVRSSRICEIEFATGGEQRHFAVALASVYSKYLRELFMRAFNDYWSEKMTGLKPTAGYYTDAHRWLTEAAPALKQAGIDRSLLVRER